MWFILHASDSAPVRKPARVRGPSLPQEYDLARVVSNISSRDPSWTTETHACAWHGVTCVVSGQVDEIKWPAMELRGTISWCHIPVTVQTVILGKYFSWERLNKITGSLPVLELPPRLETFIIDANDMTGGIDLDELPSDLIYFGVAKNRFEGSVSLSCLPQGLTILDLQENLLYGELDLTTLPSTLEKLYLANNMFYGRLILKSLPTTLVRLDIDNNKLSGELNLNSVPSTLKYVFLKNNSFTGHVDLRTASKYLILIDLKGNNISSVEPIPHPQSLRCDLGRLPSLIATPLDAW